MALVITGMTASTGSDSVVTTSSSLLRLLSRYSSKATRPSPSGQACQDAHQVDPHAIGAHRPFGQPGAVEDPELFADLPAFEVHGDLRLLALLQQRV